MARAFFFLFFLVAAQASDAIHQGKACSGECGAYQNTLLILSIEKDHFSFLCSGTLIAPDVVLTDSNCVRDSKNGALVNPIFVSNKSHFDPNIPALQNFLSILGVVRLAVHHPTQNLSVLFLNHPVSAKPSILITLEESAQLRYIDSISVAGYGEREYKTDQTTIWDKMSPKRELPFLIKRFGTNTITKRTEYELLLEPKNGENSACVGDEGGPVFADINALSDNYQRLIGIISKNRNQLECKSPTAVLPITPLLSFIDESLKRNCQTKARVWCEVPGILEPEYFDKTIENQPVEPEIPLCPATELLPQPAARQTELRKDPEHAKMGSALNDPNGETGRPAIIENLGCRCTKTIGRR